MLGRTMASLAALTLAGCNAHASSSAADPENRALLDKMAITDLLGRYYSNFGGTASDAFDRYYTDDATFDVNGHVAHGKKEIEGIYAGLAAGGASPASRGTFHMLMTNPVIDVNGDTATARLLWTGVLNTKVDAPRSSSSRAASTTGSSGKTASGCCRSASSSPTADCPISSRTPTRRARTTTSRRIERRARRWLEDRESRLLGRALRRYAVEVEAHDVARRALGGTGRHGERERDKAKLPEHRRTMPNHG